MKETTERDRDIIYFAMMPANILSVFGCIFIITVFLSFKVLHKFAFTLVFVLTIFDLIMSLSFLVPVMVIDLYSSACVVQGFIINFSSFCGVLWTTFISISLYSIIAKHNLVLEKYWKNCLIGVVVISLGISAVPLFTGSYGEVAGWCWISQTGELDAGFYERFLGFFVPVWLMIILIMVLYILLIVSIKNTTQDQAVIKSFTKKLSVYPIILVICYLPYTVKAVLEMTGNGFASDHIVEFTSIAGIFRGLIGFFNAIVYGYTKRVKEEIRKAFNRSQSEDALSLACGINKEDLVKSPKANRNLAGSQCTVFSDSFTTDD